MLVFIMETDYSGMKEAVDRIYQIAPGGTWPVHVWHFLKRPAALQFMAEFMAESGKPLDETVLILLAAMRFLDLDPAEPGAPTIVESNDGAANLDLFFVRHHAELFHLCRSRHVQANLFERALPIMEVLGRRFGQEALAVIELGCSFGLIGRALCNPQLVLGAFDRLFIADQQRPTCSPRVEAYRGIDLSIPDVQWLLACISRPDARRRSALFINTIPPGKDVSIDQGSAFDFADHGVVKDLLISSLQQDYTPVVLTSFMLYQFGQETRKKLRTTISEFTHNHGATWINLDLEPLGSGYDFFIEENGLRRVSLDTDVCRYWHWIDHGS